MIRFSLAGAVLALFSVAASAMPPIPVSTQGYNRFTFDSPFQAVVLPPDAPVASKPVALGGNRTLLLEFSPGITEPVQMIVQMLNGQVFDLSLVPGADVPAQWIAPGGETGRTPVQRPTDKNLVEIFRQVMAGPNSVPDGFRQISTPNASKIRGLTADYLSAYESRAYRVYVLRLRADRKAPILPQDLYSKGVAAVYIEGDAVGPNVAPMAVVLQKRGDHRGR